VLTASVEKPYRFSKPVRFEVKFGWFRNKIIIENLKPTPTK